VTLDLDPERKLALAYVPARVRPAIEALWRLDMALGSVLATGTEPMISRIRLAWWRESLERLDREKAPAEPVLQTLAAEVLPLGVTGAELSKMEVGWEVLLSPELLGEENLKRYAFARGGLLFRHSARLLGRSDATAESGGEVWALADLARHSGNAEDAEAAARAAHAILLRERWPSSLRPLGMLVMLAKRDAARAPDLEPQGSPARIWRMLRHRLTGA
jgi:15-cis-phytoene synthase